MNNNSQTMQLQKIGEYLIIFCFFISPFETFYIGYRYFSLSFFCFFLASIIFLASHSRSYIDYVRLIFLLLLGVIFSYFIDPVGAKYLFILVMFSVMRGCSFSRSSSKILLFVLGGYAVAAIFGSIISGDRVSLGFSESTVLAYFLFIGYALALKLRLPFRFQILFLLAMIGLLRSTTIFFVVAFILFVQVAYGDVGRVKKMGLIIGSLALLFIIGESHFARIVLIYSSVISDFWQAMDGSAAGRLFAWQHFIEHLSACQLVLACDNMSGGDVFFGVSVGEDAPIEFLRLWYLFGGLPTFGFFIWLGFSFFVRAIRGFVDPLLAFVLIGSFGASFIQLEIFLLYSILVVTIGPKGASMCRKEVICG